MASIIVYHMYLDPMRTQVHENSIKYIWRSHVYGPNVHQVTLRVYMYPVNKYSVQL